MNRIGPRRLPPKLGGFLCPCGFIFFETTGQPTSPFAREKSSAAIRSGRSGDTCIHTYAPTQHRDVSAVAKIATAFFGGVVARTTRTKGSGRRWLAKQERPDESDKRQAIQRSACPQFPFCPLALKRAPPAPIKNCCQPTVARYIHFGRRPHPSSKGSRLPCVRYPRQSSSR